jgi:hypothetical protein
MSTFLRVFGTVALVVILVLVIDDLYGRYLDWRTAKKSGKNKDEQQ